MSTPDPAKPPSSNPDRPARFTSREKLLAAIAAGAVLFIVCLGCCPITTWFAWDLAAKGLPAVVKVRDDPKEVITGNDLRDLIHHCERYAAENRNVWPERL